MPRVISVNEGAVPAEIASRLDPVVLALFSSEDFHRVDMRSLARAAGMSFTTIYRYFGDKETLLFWFIARWLEDLNPPAMASLLTAKPLKDRLRDCMAIHFDFYQKNPDVGRIIFLTVPLDRWMRDDTFANAALTKLQLQVLSEGQKHGELRDDVSTIALLDAFTAMFNRTFLMWEYRQRKYALTEQLDSTFSILWNGICPVAKSGS